MLLLLAPLTLPSLDIAGPATPEILCGPDIVTIGDAWEKVQLQNSEAQRLLETHDYLRLPQKLAAISVHLQFMQRGAIMLFGKQRTQMDKGLSVFETLRAGIVNAVLQGETQDLAARWGEVEAMLKFIATQLPDESLLPSTSFAHLLPPVKPALHIQFEPLASLVPDQPVRIVFQLVRLDNLSPMGPGSLFSTHGAPLHALICDRTLTDYHHEHPTPTGAPGEWEFTFTPKFNDHYRIWLNTVPKHTGREEFAMNVISLPNPNIPPSVTAFQPALIAQTAHLRGELTWTTGDRLEMNRPSSGRLHVLDAHGLPVRDLEPYMGAFAHIVGIGEDNASILHVHPDGGVASPSDRSGPDVHFTLRPNNRGFHRLFVQLKRGGQVQTLAFGVNID